MSNRAAFSVGTIVWVETPLTCICGQINDYVTTNNKVPGMRSKAVKHFSKTTRIRIIGTMLLRLNAFFKGGEGDFSPLPSARFYHKQQGMRQRGKSIGSIRNVVFGSPQIKQGIPYQQ